MLTCITCGKVNPPPTKSCTGGGDHTFDKAPGVCRGCSRLVAACEQRECNWRRKQREGE